ncbi:hypothetical protein BZL41_11345 [Pseudomonas sp. PIC25]|uniref:hypothetical protein n=1 Tax=Pseudomonas sp. PIC25 TaxID=1958773 RepID=UPI000BAB3DA0|nr:hypothetical protein [Pseudomonas sp. PIC25]PAU63907.1 hypothetical protein BZL41_11345 [Pseudomonas sp. PIC25]
MLILTNFRTKAAIASLLLIGALSANAEEVSDELYGILSINVSNTHYTAVVKDTSAELIENYQSSEPDDTNNLFYKAYLVKTEIIDVVHGELPKFIEIIAQQLAFKDYTVSLKPYLLSFCKTPGGKYYVPENLTRAKATPAIIRAAKELASELPKDESTPCISNTKRFVPAD